MTNENYAGYQYDKCLSRGICSINPTTASLQEVVFIYLKMAAYYGLKTEECGKLDKRIVNLILNTLSVLSSNYEISETNFEMINSAFRNELPKIIKENNDCLNGTNLDPYLFETNINLNDYIRYGEREFNKRIKNLTVDDRSLYKMLFLLVKSFCVNILTYESYGHELKDEVISVFKVLNLLNTSGIKKSGLTERIKDVAEKDCALMIKIRNYQEELYGKQDVANVSFSTTKGKAVLVVGSNLRELEQILDVFNNTNVDIYTHDNMILAHTFPKFREYKNLKGQFGQGMESCLLDFSTFPGPIILTRHSLFNVESLYRGILYTTDVSYSKGVISIKNNNFSEVIKSANEAKGFKTGKVCDSEEIGFSLAKIISKIEEKLEFGIYNQIILAGIGGYSAEEKEYFKTFTKHAPKDVLIITLFCCRQQENVVCINAGSDASGMNRLFNKILAEFSQKITLFFPYIDRHTLSVIINLSKNKKAKIYIGNWNRTVINPDVAECLKSEFGVFEITTPKNDLNSLKDVK